MNPHHFLLSREPQFEVKAGYSIQNTEGDGKDFTVTAIKANGQEAAIVSNGRLTARDVQVTLIPYYAWNHRGAGKMDVWLARSLSGLED